MAGIACLLLLVLTGASQNNRQKAPASKDSISVSAGISKEQLALEAQLNDVLAVGERARRSGDAAGAIHQLERARDMVTSQRLLSEQQDRVLNALGAAYLGAKRPADAITTFSAILKLRRHDCPPESGSLSKCADAERSLGFSRLMAGNFDGALDPLRDAETNYGNAAKPDDFEEYRMIEAKSQAESRTLISIALFGLGRRDEATKSVESAIRQLKEVKSNPNIQQSIRDSAADSLRRAQEQLEQIKR